MKLSLDPAWLSAFLLGMVRATAWLFVAPPFNSNGIPLKVRLALGMGLGLYVAPTFRDPASLVDSWSFISSVVYQAAIGLAMGFGVLLLISAFQAAGSLIDISAGFSAASVYDPMSNSAATPVARLYQGLAIALLFASNGHAVMVKGFLASFDVAGVGDATTPERVIRILSHDVATFFGAALQMALPLMAVLFVAEVAVGLMSRAAPQLQVLPVSFGVKMGAAIFMVGLAIKVLPGMLYPLVEQAAQTMVALGR